MNVNKIVASLLALALALGSADLALASQSGSAADCVRAHSTDSYRLWFDAGEPMLITVSGDMDTDLDLRVRDSRGRVIAADLDATDQCVVGFTPSRSGFYTVEIRNLGRVHNCYQLLVL